MSKKQAVIQSETWLDPEAEIKVPENYKFVPQKVSSKKDGKGK
jgi:hypothetical protein